MATQQSSQGPSQPIDTGLAFIFKYDDLQEATKFFNPSEVVGEGGFGVVYRGELSDGRAVAIKELTVRDEKRVEQFFNEVRVLSQLRHKNLVILYGCTDPEDEKMLLVYEFVPNGTIADHLHHRRFSKKAFTWSQRLQIAIETADALTYLHSLQPPIIHRDIKTNNILLDNSFNVKVADFGLCRHLPPSGTHISTMPQGTQGYLDPEYNQFYRLTTKSDVYSFGVVLMELISGKAVLDFERDDDEIWLVNMAFNKMKNHQLEQLVDPELGYLEDPKIYRMVNSVAQLAYECLQPRGHRRPPMIKVLKSLKEISDDDASSSSDNETFMRRLTFGDAMSLRENSDDDSSALTEVAESLKKTSVDDASTSSDNEKFITRLTFGDGISLEKIRRLKPLRENSDEDSSALTEVAESLKKTSVDDASTTPGNETFITRLTFGDDMSLKKIRRFKPLMENSDDDSSALTKVAESLKKRPTLREVWDATLKKIRDGWMA